MHRYLGVSFKVIINIMERLVMNYRVNCIEREMHLNSLNWNSHTWIYWIETLDILNKFFDEFMKWYIDISQKDSLNSLYRNQFTFHLNILLIKNTTSKYFKLHKKCNHFDWRDWMTRKSKWLCSIQWSFPTQIEFGRKKGRFLSSHIKRTAKCYFDGINISVPKIKE